MPFPSLGRSKQSSPPPTPSAHHDRDTRTPPEFSESAYLSPAEAASRRAEGITPLPNFSPSQPGEPSPFILPAPPSAHSGRPHVGNVTLPNLVWHLNPTLKIKLRKRFYPLGITRLTLGTDFDVKAQNIGFKWSWKDRFVGGRLEFFDNQISFTKRFDLDKRTKLDVRAAFDIQTRKSLFSLKVRPFGAIVPYDRPHAGLSIKQKFPLERRVALEMQGRLTVPEARFSNDAHTTMSLGEGDFVFDFDQLNIRFLLQ